MTAPNPGLDALRELIAEQPLVKRYSNTVTSIAGLGVNVVWVLISLGVDVPEQTTIAVAVAIQVLATIGVRFTPNGVTEKQVAEIEEYVGRHRSEG